MFTAAVMPTPISEGNTTISTSSASARRIAATAMNIAPPAINPACETAARLSALPCPYGCSSSAGCIASRIVKNASPEARTSSPLSTPSPNSAIDPNASPRLTFSAISTAFETTARIAARIAISVCENHRRADEIVGISRRIPSCPVAGVVG